jgi:hypothetical protein
MKPSFKILALAGLMMLTVNASAQDKNFYVFLCLGQSNMEGFPGIQPQDAGPVDDRFQLLAAVDVARTPLETGALVTLDPVGHRVTVLPINMGGW